MNSINNIRFVLLLYSLFLHSYLCAKTSFFFFRFILRYFKIFARITIFELRGKQNTPNSFEVELVNKTVAFTKCLCVRLHRILCNTKFSTSVTYFYTPPKLLGCLKNSWLTWSYRGIPAVQQRERTISVASSFISGSQTRLAPTLILHAWDKILSINFFFFSLYGSFIFSGSFNQY